MRPLPYSHVILPQKTIFQYSLSYPFIILLTFLIPVPIRLELHSSLCDSTFPASFCTASTIETKKVEVAGIDNVKSRTKTTWS